jgi:hypothetical protein
MSDKKLTDRIEKAVYTIAIADARIFFEEWQEPLDSAATDWDAVTWDWSSAVVTEIDESADPEIYWDLYSATLEAETKRLSSEFDSRFQIKTDFYELEVIGTEFDNRHNIVIRLPKIRITYLESNKTGFYKEILAKLRQIDPNLSYRFNPLTVDTAEGDRCIGLIETAPISESERLAYELARDCGYDVISA